MTMKRQGAKVRHQLRRVPGERRAGQRGSCQDNKGADEAQMTLYVTEKLAHTELTLRIYFQTRMALPYVGNHRAARENIRDVRSHDSVQGTTTTTVGQKQKGFSFS